MKTAVPQGVPTVATSQITSPAAALLEGLTAENAALIREAQQMANETLERGLTRESELEHAEACSVLGRIEPGAEQGWNPNSGVPLAYAKARAAWRAEVLKRAADQVVNPVAELLWDRADTLAQFGAALVRAVLGGSYMPRFAALGGALLGGMGGLGRGEDDYLTHQLEVWLTRAARDFNQSKPITGREVRLKEFTVAHKTTITRVYELANVHKRDMTRWRKVQLKDSSEKAKRIEAVLRGDTPLE